MRVQRSACVTSAPQNKRSSKTGWLTDKAVLFLLKGQRRVKDFLSKSYLKNPLGKAGGSKPRARNPTVLEIVTMI